MGQVRLDLAKVIGRAKSAGLQIVTKSQIVSKSVTSSEGVRLGVGLGCLGLGLAKTRVIRSDRNAYVITPNTRGLRSESVMGQA